MQQNRSYAIIGCGAVGGYYGGLLQRSGHAVHYLLHSDYTEAVERGLRIDSPEGSFRLPEINAYRRPEDMPQCDVAIVAFKATANHLLPAILPHVLGPDSTVLLLQNGLGAEEGIATTPGVSTLLGGLCFLCSRKAGPAWIQHLDYGYITLGQHSDDGRPSGETAIMQEVRNDFVRSGIQVTLEPDLLAARWKKLVWNIPFNGLTVLLNATTEALMQDAGGRAIVEALMHETAAAAAAYDRPIPEPFIEKMLSNTERMKPYAPSMKQDYDAGRQLELEAIYAEPIRRSLARGVDMPMTRFLYNALRFMEERHSGQP